MTKVKSRGAQGGGSIRKRPDGRWEARYTTGFDPKTGKQIQRSIYGKTQKEVRQKLNQVTAEIDSGDYLEPSGMKLRDWLDNWMTDYSGDKKYSTMKHYRAACETHIKPRLGDVPLSKLNAVMVQKFYNSLSHPEDGEKALSPKTVKNVHGILSKAMSQAARNGLIKFNPCEGAVLPKVSKKEIRPLSNEQVKGLLELADSDEVYGILLKLIVLTGLREAEAMGLTWDCVDFEKGTILVNKQLQKRLKSAGGMVFSSLKNGKPRLLRPAPYVMELLRQRQERQRKQRLEAGEAWEEWHDAQVKGSLVFTTLTGSYLSPQTVYNHFKVMAAKLGVPNARVHDLRHTFAVLSLENGDDIKTVQGNLGHATAAFTLDVYGHVSDTMQKASAERMERFVQSIVNA